MNLFLCEKPSQAKDLAAVLGNPDIKNTHVECDAGIVTWASGHLLELPQPDAIDSRYKRWAAEDLPILPVEFTWQPKEGRALAQLNAIGDLLKTSTNVVLATDAEREGELIGRNILNHHNYAGPMQRLWLKGLDPASIRHALDNLLPGDEKDALFDSALTRAKSDWLVGMNASRAATIQMGRPGEPVPVGRVQTPTLAMIVNRDKMISEFKPESFFKIEFDAKGLDGTNQRMRMVIDKDSPLPQQDVVDELGNSEGVKAMLEVATREISTPPPLLFNLSGLQQKTNAIWGWTADHTLKVAQRLYEHHKFLSYPRSDSTVLPAEQEVLIPATLANLRGTVLGKNVPAAPVVRPTTFVADLGTAHHAIIPTTLKPDIQALSADERKAFLLVSKSYIAALHSDYKAKEITNTVKIGEHVFTAKGFETTEPGWRSVSTVPIPDSPAFRKSGEIAVSNISAIAAETKPPGRYTDGTLIGDMTHIRKFVSKPEVLAVLRENSALGTEATRASVIEGLLTSGMLKRDGVSLRSTSRAQRVIGALQDAVPRLVSPAETAIWEDGLRRIEERSLTVDKFMDGITKRVHSHTRNLLSIERVAAAPESVTVGHPIKVNCPTSGLPVRDNGKSWVFPGHADTFCPKFLAKRKMDAEVYATLFAGKDVGNLDGFCSKAGKPFSASLKLNSQDGSFKFDFSQQDRERPLPGRSKDDRYASRGRDGR